MRDAACEVGQGSGKRRSGRVGAAATSDVGHWPGAWRGPAGGAVEWLEPIAGVLLFTFAAVWVTWLLGGSLINRRRAAALSRWVYAELKPYGNKLSVRWITL